MKYSIIMTVHDREPELLLGSLRSLFLSGLSDSEVIIVNDRSNCDYSWVKPYMQQRFTESRWIDTGDYEGYRFEGYGNPAHAFNLGLEVASKEGVLLMSSDVIVTRKAVRSLEKHHNPDCFWTPKIIDMDTQAEYCGPGRVFPMPWFLAAPTEACLAVGGWDENYLGGLCWEDNDFVGRLGLKLGALRADWDVVSYHHSHFQPAYEFGKEEVEAANLRNRDYTKAKWGGLPFDGEFTPFDVSRRPDPSGCQRFEFRGNDIDRLVRDTNGIKTVVR